MQKITMRQLQKMSARKIRALPHSVPIKSGKDTVALLVPIRKPPKEVAERAFARIEAEAAKRSPKRTAELEAALDALEAE